MPQPNGIYRPLSPARRYLCELYRLAVGVPTASVRHTLSLTEIAATRDRALPRPSWTALHLKAISHVAAWYTPLRSAYFSFPFARLYEHPVGVAAVLVEQPGLDGSETCPATLERPETLGLPDLDDWLESQRQPGNDSLRRVLTLDRWPATLRRLANRWGLMLSGRCRAARIGTFGVAMNGGPLPLVATTLCPGPLLDDGTAEVELFFDPRALDATDAARALDEHQRALTDNVLAELRYRQRPEAA